MLSCRNPIVRSVTTLVATSALAACATIKVQPESLTSIERVAIVGFEATDQFSTSSIDSDYVYGTDIGSGSSTIDTLTVASAATADAVDVLTAGGGENLPVYPQIGAHAYDTLVEMMQSALDVEVLAREDLVANEAYATEFSQKMAWLDPSKRDVSAGPPTPKPFTLTTYHYPVEPRAVPIGLIWSRMLSEQDPGERDVFMDRLGVDAIALVQVIWTTGRTTRPNSHLPIEVFKVYHPAATVVVTMYKRGVDEPVWLDQSATGCPSTNGVVTKWGKPEGDADLVGLINEATANGYRKALKRLKNARYPESVEKRSFFTPTTSCL